MAYLVDAFNLMRSVPRLSDLLDREGPPAACRALAEVVAGWLGVERRARVVLVFDGTPGGLRLRQVERLTCHWAAADADGELIRRLRRGGGGDVLVSADGEIVAAARGVGSEVRDPAGFFGGLLADLEAAREERTKAHQPAAWEVSLWLDYFQRPPAPRRRPVPRANRRLRAPVPPPAPPHGRRRGRRRRRERSGPLETNLPAEGLSPEQVDAWAEELGPGAEDLLRAAEPPAEEPPPARPARPRNKTVGPLPTALPTDGLSPEEVAAWAEVFRTAQGGEDRATPDRDLDRLADEAVGRGRPAAEEPQTQARPGPAPAPEPHDPDELPPAGLPPEVVQDWLDYFSQEEDP